MADSGSGRTQEDSNLKSSEKLRVKNGYFYKSVSIVLKASCGFMMRYSELAAAMVVAEPDPLLKKNLEEISVSLQETF